MKNLKLLICLSFFALASIGWAQQTYIYVSDAGGFTNPPWQILRYNIDGSNPQVFIDNDWFVSEGVGWPQDILFLEDQEVVLISNLVGNRITKHDATTGAYIEDFAAVAGGPTRMKIGADDLIYVLQWSNSVNQVLRFEQDGTPLGEFTNEGVPQSIGLDWDSAGNLYVSSYGGGTVRQFNSSGVDQGLFVDTELSGPTNIWFNPNGELLVLDWTAGDVERFDASGNHIDTYISGLSQPEGIDVLPDGNLLLGNGGPAQVDQFLPDGTFVESTVTSGAGGLIQPNAVVLRDAKLLVPENDSQSLIVVPTIGNRFSFENNASHSIETIYVYNTLGTIVDTIQFHDQTHWDAQHLSEGIYLLQAIDTQGERYQQKIMVKK